LIVLDLRHQDFCTVSDKRMRGDQFSCLYLAFDIKPLLFNLFVMFQYDIMTVQILKMQDIKIHD